MPVTYEDKYERSFVDCLQRHRDKKKCIEALVQRIPADPFSQSHLLGEKSGIDLRGIRSRHFAKNFVILYMVCDECITKGFREQNDCAFCTGEPLRRVIFLAFGPHDDIYTRQWKDIHLIP